MRSVQTRFARRGLTFIELMFSTVILGVGMIMIAALFPVAINEQRAMVDESTVSNLERGAVRTLNTAISVNKPQLLNWLPTTINGTKLRVASFAGAPDANLWKRIRGELVNKADGRYAWTALYARETATNPGADLVRLFIISLVSREAGSFEDADPVKQADKLDALQPQQVKITYFYKEESPNNELATQPEEDSIRIEGNGPAVAAAAEGAYVIRGTFDNMSQLEQQNAIIKLGAEFTGDELVNGGVSSRNFRIQGGFTLPPNTPPGTLTDANAWVIGRNIPADGSLPVGANQAIGCRAVTLKIQDPG